MAVLLALAPRVARAQEVEGREPEAAEVRSKQLVWSPAWPRVRPVEYIATGVLGLAAFGTLFMKPSPGRWDTSNGFDDAFRAGLRLTSPSARDTARVASDVLLYAHLGYPIVVDSTVVAWWARGAGDVAWQTAVIDLESLALTAFVSGFVSNVASRQRPYGRTCGGDDAGRADCADKRYRSFFSGHTSTAFTSAGLICIHHMRMPLYGGGAPDAIACGTAILSAAATGALRALADQHYATDILTGAAVGTLSGFVLPYALHYRKKAAPTPVSGELGSSRRAAAPTFTVVPAPLGASVIGTF